MGAVEALWKRLVLLAFLRFLRMLWGKGKLVGFLAGKGRGRLKKFKCGRRMHVLEAVMDEDLDMSVAFEAFPSGEAGVAADDILVRAKRMKEVGESVGVKYHGSEEQVLQDCVDHLRLSHPRRYR